MTRRVECVYVPVDVLVRNAQHARVNLARLQRAGAELDVADLRAVHHALELLGCSEVSEVSHMVSQHDDDGPPPEDWILGASAAESVGLTPQAIGKAVRADRLRGRVWKGRLYVDPRSLEEEYGHDATTR